MSMRASWFFCLSVFLASQARAVVIFSDDYEAFPDGDITCTTLQTTGGYGACRELGPDTNPNNPSEISIASSVPGSVESLPSGLRVMRIHTNGMTLQSDAGVGIGAAELPAYDNYIPADSWWQVAFYVNNYGSEVSVTGSRPMKLFYPCRDAYPCTTNYFLIETNVTSSYNPFNSAELIEPTNGDMWISTRDSAGAAWAGAPLIDQNKLGQTNLSERIRPNRWNIVRCHGDFSDAASAKMDCWIGPKGAPLTHVLSWHGGTPVEGSAFTWTVPVAGGHRAMWFPSTVPANATVGTELFMYFDDFCLATSEGDLPVYSTDTTTPAAPTELQIL